MMNFAKILQDVLVFGCWIRFADDMFSASRARGTAEPKRELIQIALRRWCDSAGRDVVARAKGMVV